jgi:hypothetical protein
MTELESLTRRVEQLEARVAIAELVSGYAIACDEHDIERLGTQFAEDAVLDSPSKLLSANGRAEILAMYRAPVQDPRPGLPLDARPFRALRQPPDPDRATGLVLSHAETCPDNEVSVSGMRYDDEYRRVDGRWMFQKRTLKFLYYVPAKDYTQALTGTTRVTMGGRSCPATSRSPRRPGRPSTATYGRNGA